MAGCCDSQEGRAAERRGAALLISWWLFQGQSISTIGRQFQQRFGPIPAVEYERLLDLGTRARDAGRSLGLLPSEQSVPLEQIPIASGLPESHWEGGRFSLDVELEYTDPTSGEVLKRRTTFKSSTQTTLGEIYSESEDWLQQMAEEYPDRFPGLGVLGEETTIDIGTISIVRRY